MNKFTKRALAVAAGTAVLTSAGVAYAYWTSTGSGTGSASTGDSSPFDVSADEVTSNTLTPGGPAQTVNFTVHNPSTGYQRLGTVKIKVANADGSAWEGVTVGSLTCTAADFAIGTAAAGAEETVTADSNLAGENAGTTDDYTDSVDVQMVNTNENQDACKNVASVPLYLYASSI